MRLRVLPSHEGRDHGNRSLHRAATTAWARAGRSSVASRDARTYTPGAGPVIEEIGNWVRSVAAGPITEASFDGFMQRQKL